MSHEIITRSNVDNATRSLLRTSRIYALAFVVCLVGVVFSAYMINPWLAALLGIAFVALYTREQYIVALMKRKALGNAEGILAEQEAKSTQQHSHGGTYV